jgi:hypothetical protein
MACSRPIGMPPPGSRRPTYDGGKTRFDCSVPRKSILKMKLNFNFKINQEQFRACPAPRQMI